MSDDVMSQVGDELGTTPNITVIDGHAATTSMAVAEFFGKQHFHVMRAIRSILDADPEAQSNFGSGAREDRNGQQRPYYTMDRTGFVMLGMGFTGAQAIRWRRRYIAAFDAMEAEINGGAGGNTDRLALRQHRIAMIQRLQNETHTSTRAEIHAELAWACDQLGMPTPSAGALLTDSAKYVHNTCADFFEAVCRLVTDHGCNLDHSMRADQVALNLKEVCGFADAYGVPIPARTRLTRVLKQSTAPKIIEHNYSIKSGLTGLSKRCWIFAVNDEALASEGIWALLEECVPDPVDEGSEAIMAYYKNRFDL